MNYSEEMVAKHKEIGALYNKEMFRRKNRMNKDLTDKIWLQQEAINALPQHLFEKAMVIDHTPPPSDRPFPMYDTPPIPDFDPYSVAHPEPIKSTHAQRLRTTLSFVENN
jgi:hypothetical protein